MSSSFEQKNSLNSRIIGTNSSEFVLPSQPPPLPSTLPQGDGLYKNSGSRMPPPDYNNNNNNNVRNRH